MAGQANRDLYLQVGGDVSNLKAAMKDGRSSLLDLVAAAQDAQDETNQALRSIAADPAALKQLVGAYDQTFAAIRRNAQAAMSANDNTSALKIIDAAGAEQQAAAVAVQAAQLRIAADAAAAVAERQGEAGVSARVLAAALEVQALDAAKVSAAMRGQADVLAEVAAEARLAGAREDEVTGAHARMGASGMIADHVMRAFADSIAAGQSPVRALAMELPRIGEAMSMVAMQAGNTESAFGKFAALMSGGYGLAITAALAIAGPLVEALFDEGDAQKEAAKATKEHVDAILALEKAEGEAVLSEEAKLRRDYLAIEAEHQRALSIRNTTVALLQQAVAQQTANRQTAVAQQQYGTKDSAAFGQAYSDSDVATLQASLTKAQGDLQKTQTAALQAGGRYIKNIIDGNMTPAGKIKARADTRQQLAEKELERTGDYKTFARTTTTIDVDKQEALDALKPGRKGRKPKVDHTAEREANKDRAYQSELNTAQDRVAKAQLSLADTAEGRFKLEVEELNASKVQRDLEIDDQVKAKKISQAEADKLKALNAEATELEKQAARRKEVSALLQQQLTSDEHARAARDAVLQIDADMATTRAERLQKEQQLLTDSQTGRRDKLNNVLQDPNRSDADKQLARQDLAALPAQEAAERRQQAKQNEDPLEAYGDQLKSKVGDMNDALKGVAADGMKGVEDGLVGLISGTESAAQAFKKMAASIISDLARIAIEKAFVAVLGFKDGNVPGFATGHIPGFASGIIRGPGTGTSDSILGYMQGVGSIFVSNGESIMTAEATRRYGPSLKAMNDNTFPAFATGLVPDSALGYPALPSAQSIARPAPPPQVIYLQVDKSELFNTHVARIAAPLAQAAMVGGAQQAQQDFADQRMASIP